MKLFPIDTDREALEKYLQELIYDAGSPQEVDVLTAALYSLRYEAQPEKQKLQFPSWQVPLREAQSQTDLETVHQKVMEAEGAMWIRMQELAASNDYQESLAIERACRELLTIKTKKLGWPSIDPMTPMLDRKIR
jgi:hypothetical protein